MNIPDSAMYPQFTGGGGNCPNHENLIETQCHGFDMLEFLCSVTTAKHARFGKQVISTMLTENSIALLISTSMQ